MEKVLLVMNAHHPDVSSIEFGCRIARYLNTTLTGLFIEQAFPEFLPGNSGIMPVYLNAVGASQEPEVLADTNQALRIFKDECDLKDIKYDIYIEKGESINVAIRESRFADLLLVSPKLAFWDGDYKVPTHFVKELLTGSECPVILIPAHFQDIEEVVFCYDGSRSAVFAIKQFTYLIPEFISKKALLLEVSRTGKSDFDDDLRRMMTWLRAHYKSACYYALKGDAKDQLASYFLPATSKIIVMGAYGRSMISRLFVKSKADDLLKNGELPVFITHH